MDSHGNSVKGLLHSEGFDDVTHKGLHRRISCQNNATVALVPSSFGGGHKSRFNMNVAILVRVRLLPLPPLRYGLILSLLSSTVLLSD